MTKHVNKKQKTKCDGYEMAPVPRQQPSAETSPNPRNLTPLIKAYNNPIWENARKDLTSRHPVPGPTYGSENYKCPKHFYSLPVSRDPRSRPFFAFANSKPTPPPYTFSPESSDASTEGSAETTCSERNQSIITFVDTDTHSIYSGSGITEDALSFQDDDDGDGNYDSDGNDDTDDDGEGDGEDSPSGETVVGDDKIPEKKPVFTRVRALYTITINTMKSKSERVKTLFTTMKAEFKRVEAAHNARRKWLAFWAEGASYRLKLRRQTLAIYVRLYLRRIFARLRPILLKAFAAFVMAMILSQMAPLFPGWLDDDDDIFDGEIAYYLVDEDRRWSAAS